MEVGEIVLRETQRELHLPRVIHIVVVDEEASSAQQTWSIFPRVGSVVGEGHEERPFLAHDVGFRRGQAIFFFGRNERGLGKIANNE